MGGTKRDPFWPREPTQWYIHPPTWELLAEKIRTGNAKALLCLYEQSDLESLSLSLRLRFVVYKIGFMTSTLSAPIELLVKLE